MNAPFWIIHQPTRLTTLDEATALAGALREEDRHFLRHRD